MLLSSDRFILMTLAGLCRRPSLGCEWHEACLGGNGNGLRSRHSYAPLRKQTVLAWVLPLSARSRTKLLGRGSVLISDNNFWNLYTRDSSLLSEELSECFQGSFLWFHILLFRWSILSFVTYDCLGGDGIGRQDSVSQAKEKVVVLKR
ncbi:hypothetical protein ACN38_g11173 [Penicillium nordicum]|uniref:Uncharacterized protein n=1 Tax=Penicillium nordicum TaxID=229535 RepID=A0A0M9WAZ2_9EURO|nr:hypothetical protein ACN38_g11173 [Penicillium nordicum]